MTSPRTQPRIDLTLVGDPVRVAAKALRRDGAPVVRASRLSRGALEDLADERTCAIHVRGFFDARAAASAARRLGDERQQRWVVDGRVTDTSFSIGIPRQYGERSPKHEARYQREAARANQLLRDAFAPSWSPLDRLRLELDELWVRGATLGKFEGRPALAGLLRTVEPSSLFEGVAATRGVIHMDQPERAEAAAHRLSAILYLAMPPRGGELRVWDLAIDAENFRNLAYRLCARHGFDSAAQDLLHEVLGRPRTITPRAGDLVLIDTARPHAVAGFTRGRRVAVQSWLVAAGRDRPLTIYA